MSTTPSNKRAARVTTTRLAEMKAAGERIVMVTAYDAPGARAADAAGVDAILVGDSLGMTVLGYDSTLPVTMSDMVRATAAVSRGASRALVVADLPFLSYQVSIDEAVRNAGRLLVEGSAQAVKLEGGVEVADLVNVLVDTGIPVMGHVGLTPQSVNVFGGYKTQGKDTESAVDLVEDCLTLEAAGAFAVVLELVPVELARLISEELTIPTIGIGAGAACDGQVQVFHDLLGIGDFTPRHARRYAEIGEAITAALAEYSSDVRSGAFPAEEQSTHLDAEVAAELDRMVPFTGEGE
ncbi:3-methyl-2-oxobutanoate hydroxymethyltransferase [Anaerosoma tenue]|uniref:3-methyl-2-oxobutanoate hydroxymethyltransferase n=1 Tax=Anaerosoma tenue TaxID=2933588 RepID=UPI002260CDD4|nr:3-methyl-2-oxobutanoate hydroxymethyltransferase [Anaerosoma tenue]MCK8114724.1 3-methyl-2-oxobutanoate hydroxymethyltransferase [Anaerosoma tenue]